MLAVIGWHGTWVQQHTKLPWPRNRWEPWLPPSPWQQPQQHGCCCVVGTFPRSERVPAGDCVVDIVEFECDRSLFGVVRLERSRRRWGTSTSEPDIEKSSFSWNVIWKFSNNKAVLMSLWSCCWGSKAFWTSLKFHAPFPSMQNKSNNLLVILRCCGRVCVTRSGLTRLYTARWSYHRQLKVRGSLRNLYTSPYISYLTKHLLYTPSDLIRYVRLLLFVMKGLFINDVTLGKLKGGGPFLE